MRQEKLYNAGEVLKKYWKSLDCAKGYTIYTNFEDNRSKNVNSIVLPPEMLENRVLKNFNIFIRHDKKKNDLSDILSLFSISNGIILPKFNLEDETLQIDLRLLNYEFSEIETDGNYDYIYTFNVDLVITKLRG